MDLFYCLLFRLNQEIRDRNLVTTKDRLLLAVSGGQDSIALILFFVALRKFWLWDLGCIYCDHGWRNDARENGSHVQKIAEYYKLSYFQILPSEKFVTEEKARQWRYLQLIEIASDYNYHHVVTGHTATDRAETLLINLNRGSGCNGLHSLQWKRSSLHNQKDIGIIRPLLSLQREELKILVHQLHFPLWPDKTNEEMKRIRNKNRKQIFPFLRFLLNRNLDKSFAQFSELSHTESILLDNLTAKVYETLTVDAFYLDLIKFQLIPIAVQRRVLRLFIQTKTKKLLPFEEIEKIRYLCLNPKKVKIISLKQALLFINAKKIFFLETVDKAKRKMGRPGFEPGTYRLKAEYSTD